MSSHCIEYFGTGAEAKKYGARADGVCGRRADYVVWDGDTWGPTCERCRHFWRHDLVKPMTDELDRRITALQAALQLVETEKNRD